MMRRILFTAAALSLLSSAAVAGPTYIVGAPIASYHINAKSNLNEINPGITLGVEWDRNALSWGIEGGVYYNSYSERSFYAAGNVEYGVATLGPVELRLGAFLGLAEYSNTVDTVRDYGLPTVGDYIPIGGAQATLRFDNRVDLRVRAVPTAEDADGVITFQVLFRF